MKILIQNQYDGLLGGVETYFKLVTDALVEGGNEVVAVFTKSGRKKDLAGKGYKAFYLPNLDLDESLYASKVRKADVAKDIARLQDIVRDERPDLIHLNNTHYPEQYAFLGKYCPVIQTVHDFFNCCNTVLKMLPGGICGEAMGHRCFSNKCISPDSIMELWRFNAKSRNREAMKGFARLLVTTPYMKEVMLANGFQDEKVEVVPLFVEDWGAQPVNDDHVVIYVGRLAKEKGVSHFIQMLKGLGVSYSAYIIGDGPQLEDYENQVTISGLAPKVKFTGFLGREELKEYFAKSTVVVIPSVWPEPFCLAGLEAMSSARPVVAYDVGGISSWLRDNYNGFLLKNGDIAGLTHRVEALLRSRQLVEDMGANGRRIYQERFTRQIHMDKLISVYESVLSSQKSPPSLALPWVSALKKKHAEVSMAASLKYPVRSPGEPLPEYNKRMISFEIQNKVAKVRSYPEEITISTTTRCNMDPPCVICERNLRTRELEFDLDPMTLEKIKHIFKYADRIYLHCGGEPLMTPKIYDIIESVSPPTKIVFNTNGALFTEKSIRYMVDCNVVDVISFSLDAATEKTYKRIRSADFNRIIGNIKALISYRNEKNRGKPLLRPLVLMNFVIFKQNVYEVPDYVRLAHSLGVDGLDFSHLNAGFDWKQERADYTFDYKSESVLDMRDRDKHDELIMQAYSLGKELSVPINFNGNPFLKVDNNEKVKARDEISEVIHYNKKCEAPWGRAVIETDGRVRMCYFHNSSYETIGKLKSDHGNLYYLESDSFDEIWNGREAVSVRKEFIKSGIARRCVTGNPCIHQNRL